MTSRSDRERYAGFEKRMYALVACLSLAFLVLGARLWELQALRGAEFRDKSDRNRLRVQSLESPRGVIYGEWGPGREVALADSRPARDLMFVPADCDIEPELLAKRLEDLVGISAEDLLEEIDTAKRKRQAHTQILLRRDIPTSVSARIDEYSYALPGVFTVIRPVRRYVFGKVGGQILGYVGEISSKKELERFGERYSMGHLVGRMGIEQLYESTLHGSDGQMLVTRYAAGVPQLRTDPYGNPYVENLVDSYGHQLILEQEIAKPEAGKPIHLTLDIGLQEKAEQLLEGEQGAIVILNADSGAVMAMASNPRFDPSIFVTNSGSRKRSETLTGKPNRMLHRAYREVYAPGSVFKVLLASAALEEGVIDENTTFYCPGKFRITAGGRPWHCWKRSGHGEVKVVDALAFSCDVFFYQVGLKLGVDKISEWAKRLGVGVKSGIDLPGEVSGLIPSRQWKEDLLRPKHRNEPWEYRWYPGDTVNLAIGQGAAATTPLQNAVLMAVIVNGGHRVQPYLNKLSPLGTSDTLLSEETLRIVREGMLKCVVKGPPAPSGTGHAAYIEGIEILGKTGSAQNVSLEVHEQYETEEDIPKELRDHAWFIGGVMDRKPRIAICILVEHGHHGSTVAAPLAKPLIEYIYSSQYFGEVEMAKHEGGGL